MESLPRPGKRNGKTCGDAKNWRMRNAECRVLIVAPMNPLPTHISRRAFLAKTGIGSLALTSLLKPSLFAAAPDRWRGVIGEPHFPPKAKRVIWLTMAGGP